MIVELVVVRLVLDNGEQIFWTHTARDALSIVDEGSDWPMEVAEVAEKHGAENVRIVKVRVPRDFMIRAFEPLHVQGTVRKVERP